MSVPGVWFQHRFSSCFSFLFIYIFFQSPSEVYSWKRSSSLEKPTVSDLTVYPGKRTSVTPRHNNCVTLIHTNQVVRILPAGDVPLKDIYPKGGEPFQLAKMVEGSLLLSGVNDIYPCHFLLTSITTLTVKVAKNTSVPWEFVDTSTWPLLVGSAVFVFVHAASACALAYVELGFRELASGESPRADCFIRQPQPPHVDEAQGWSFLCPSVHRQTPCYH